MPIQNTPDPANRVSDTPDTRERSNLAGRGFGGAGGATENDAPLHPDELAKRVQPRHIKLPNDGGGPPSAGDPRAYPDPIRAEAEGEDVAANHAQRRSEEKARGLHRDVPAEVDAPAPAEVPTGPVEQPSVPRERTEAARQGAAATDKAKERK